MARALIDDKTAPGPTRGFAPTTFFALRRDPLGFLSNLARQYGDVAHFQIGPQHVYLVNRPDLIKDVLVTNNRMFVKGRGLERAKQLLGDGLLTSEGDVHHRQRRLAQPAFHRQRIASYAQSVVFHAASTREAWRDGEVRDVAKDMMALTLQIVAETMFGADVTNMSDDVRDAMNSLVDLFDLMLLPFSELLQHLPLPPTIRFRKARRTLDSIIMRIIEDRRASGEDRGDLLSLLVAARDDDGSQMTDALLRDEVLTLFLAGHETTANALTWTWYLLSQHPDVAERLHDELDDVLGGRLPTIDDLERLAFTRNVFTESMRLFPPAWVIGRRATVDYQADGYAIPAGSIVLMSQFLMHRDQRYFSAPECFDPDRWTEAARNGRPKFSYFPFGAGPRQCIGEHFAWMEGILVLATLASRWSLQCTDDNQVAMQPLVTLRPKYGMRMKTTQRPPAI